MDFRFHWQSYINIYLHHLYVVNVRQFLFISSSSIQLNTSSQTTSIGSRSTVVTAISMFAFFTISSGWIYRFLFGSTLSISNQNYVAKNGQKSALRIRVLGQEDSGAVLLRVQCLVMAHFARYPQVHLACVRQDRCARSGTDGNAGDGRFLIYWWIAAIVKLVADVLLTTVIGWLSIKHRWFVSQSTKWFCLLCFWQLTLHRPYWTTQCRIKNMMNTVWIIFYNNDWLFK